MSNIGIEKENLDVNYDDLGLENPDDIEKVKTFEFSDALQAQILAYMMFNADFYQKCCMCVKARYFREKGLQQIFQILKDLQPDVDTVPDFSVVEFEIETRFPAKIKYLFCELDKVKSFGYNPLFLKRLEPQLDRFITKQSWVSATDETLNYIDSRCLKEQPIDTNKIFSFMEKIKDISVLKNDESVIWNNDDDDIPPPSWLIEDHLTSGGLSYLLGESGVGKSFVALDFGFSVATNTKYLNKYDVEQGIVFYIGAEGSSGIKDRRKAWLKHHNVEGLQNFCYLPTDFDLNKEEGRVKLMSLIRSELDRKVGKNTMPKLIILDTLFNHLAGGNENSPDDMGEFLKTIGLLSKDFKCHVCCVAHPGHINKYRPRGHSGQKPKLDNLILVEAVKENNILSGMEVSMGKQKHSTPIKPYRIFTKLVSNLGFDVKGKERTSIVCTAIQDDLEHSKDMLDEQCRALFVTLKTKFMLQEFKRKDIIDIAGDVSRATTDRRINALIDVKLLLNSAYGKYLINPDIVPERVFNTF